MRGDHETKQSTTTYPTIQREPIYGTGPFTTGTATPYTQGHIQDVLSPATERPATTDQLSHAAGPQQHPHPQTANSKARLPARSWISPSTISIDPRCFELLIVGIQPGLPSSYFNK